MLACALPSGLSVEVTRSFLNFVDSQARGLTACDHLAGGARSKGPKSWKSRAECWPLNAERWHKGQRKEGCPDAPEVMEQVGEATGSCIQCL